MGELDDVLCLGCFSCVKGMERMVCKFDILLRIVGLLVSLPTWGNFVVDDERGISGGKVVDSRFGMCLLTEL